MLLVQYGYISYYTLSRAITITYTYKPEIIGGNADKTIKSNSPNAKEKKQF